jgi:mannitol/fructose-specific phosphotransferase system IIA component (Ntr-type)
MRLTETLKLTNIKVPLLATGKTDAIKELIQLLATNGDVPDPAKVLEAVLDREATRTTGIGYGLAIPHGRTAGASSLTMAIGRCGQPIEFQAIDGRPVSIVWLLVSPPDKSVAHIATLARITKLMMVDRFRVEMNRAPDAKAVLDLVAKQEAEMG